MHTHTIPEEWSIPSTCRVEYTPPEEKSTPSHCRVEHPPRDHHKMINQTEASYPPETFLLVLELQRKNFSWMVHIQFFHGQLVLEVFSVSSGSLWGPSEDQLPPPLKNTWIFRKKKVHYSLPSRRQKSQLSKPFSLLGSTLRSFSSSISNRPSTRKIKSA